MLRKRPSWGSPHRIQSRSRTGCTPEKSGPPLNLPYGPQRDGAPSPPTRVLSGRRGETATHVFTSSLPGAVRHAWGPGTSRSQPRSRRGCRVAEPSSTCCRRHEQAMLRPAVKVKPKAASQLAGRQAWPRHGPALSLPHKHCSGHHLHTHRKAPLPLQGRGHRRQPPRRFLQAGVSSLGLCSGGVLAEPESLKRATVKPHPGGREVGPRTTEGAPSSRLVLGAVAWEVPP